MSAALAALHWLTSTTAHLSAKALEELIPATVLPCLTKEDGDMLLALMGHESTVQVRAKMEANAGQEAIAELRAAGINVRESNGLFCIRGLPKDTASRLRSIGLRSHLVFLRDMEHSSPLKGLTDAFIQESTRRGVSAKEAKRLLDLFRRTHKSYAQLKAAAQHTNTR